MPSFQAIYQVGYESIDGTEKCWQRCNEKKKNA
jgi:hypothetical protein